MKDFEPRNPNTHRMLPDYADFANPEMQMHAAKTMRRFEEIYTELSNWKAGAFFLDRLAESVNTLFQDTFPYEGVYDEMSRRLAAAPVVHENIPAISQLIVDNMLMQIVMDSESEAHQGLYSRQEPYMRRLGLTFSDEPDKIQACRIITNSRPRFIDAGPNTPALPRELLECVFVKVNPFVWVKLRASEARGVKRSLVGYVRNMKRTTARTASTTCIVLGIPHTISRVFILEETMNIR